MTCRNPLRTCKHNISFHWELSVSEGPWVTEYICAFLLPWLMTWDRYIIYILQYNVWLLMGESFFFFSSYILFVYIDTPSNRLPDEPVGTRMDLSIQGSSCWYYWPVCSGRNIFWTLLVWLCLYCAWCYCYPHGYILYYSPWFPFLLDVEPW